MSALPEVRINFSDLLYSRESQCLAGKEKLHSYEQYKQWTANYRQAWHGYEPQIIPALQRATGVHFYKPVIDVSCAPYFVPKSDPLILGFWNEPDQFVDVLTHELCHVLLTDNNVLRIRDAQPAFDLLATWKKLFGGTHTWNTLVHIPVHALCKYIYLDILKEPARLERDQQSVKKFGGGADYTAAWDYVDHHDYHHILADIKQSYKTIVAEGAVL